MVLCDDLEERDRVRGVGGRLKMEGIHTHTHTHTQKADSCCYEVEASITL